MQKKYTCGSSKTIYPICPDCGRIKDKPLTIASIYNNHTIYCNCSDKISYPEKFITSVLNQLNIKYIYQLTKTTATWIDSGVRYDFNINNKSCIIEVNGIQHYNDKFSKLTGISIEEQNLIDFQKEQLAKSNGIEHYIVLDCRKSELEWIKKSVLESELPTLFNFNEDDIDWLKCHEFALSNIVKEVCDYKNIHNDISINELAEIFNLGSQAIRSYLKKGTLLNWCNYNAKEEHLKAVHKLKPSVYKKVEVFKDNISVGTFDSLKELVSISLEMFGVQFIQTCISAVCHGSKKSHHGFTFKLI